MNEYQIFYLGVLKVLRQSVWQKIQKNKMWHSDFWEKKKKSTDILCLPCKRIDKFLSSMFLSTQMCMEHQKMSRGHAKCDNGIGKKTQRE